MGLISTSSPNFSLSSVYKKIIKSNLADNFYIRTHFDHEANTPIGLNFTRGEVFRVLDTMYRGKMGNWLAVRMGNDLHEMDKGTIPNQAKSEGHDGSSGFFFIREPLGGLNTCCYVPQGRVVGQPRASAAAQRGEAGVRAAGRVLEAARAPREQEERKDGPSDP